MGCEKKGRKRAIEQRRYSANVFCHIVSKLGTLFSFFFISKYLHYTPHSIRCVLYQMIIIQYVIISLSFDIKCNAFLLHFPLCHFPLARVFRSSFACVFLFSTVSSVSSESIESLVGVVRCSWYWSRCIRVCLCFFFLSRSFMSSMCLIDYCEYSSCPETLCRRTSTILFFASIQQRRNV